MNQVPVADRLHLGCGRKILPGYVNVDVVEAPGVDVVCDLNLGIPFPDDSFVEVLAVDFIEHIRPDAVIQLMNDIHRVLKPGGVFRVHVPQAPGITASQDPTHVSFWNAESFTYYEDGHRRRETFGVTYGIRARFRMRSLRRKHHLWSRFFTTLDINYLANCLLDVELVAVK
jgi:predicted SAM-dependent methyltransferase